MWCGCLEPFAIERRRILKGVAALLSLGTAGCAPTATPAQRATAAALLDETISIDLHSHPGMVRGLSRATMDGHI